MAGFVNNVIFTPTLGGTTDWVVATAVGGFNTPAGAGAVNGRLYKYRAESADMSQWEVGEGTYTSGSTTLSRTTVLLNSLGTTAKINFSTVPQVGIGAFAEDLIGVDQPNAFTTAQQGRALANLGAAQNVLVNGKIVESHASNIATFAVKTLAGADPSTSDPVSVMFSDGTLRVLTAALSVSQASGTGMGTTSAVSFRLWFAIFDDGGTLRMASRNCLNSSGGISGFPGHGVGSTVNDNTGSHKTWCNGTVLADKQFAIIGFADYDGGLTTAGTWDASPTRIQLFGPHIIKPGCVISSLTFPITTGFSSASASFVNSTVAATIVPTSRQNPIRWQATVPVNNIGGNTNGLYARLHTGAAFVGPTYYTYNGAGAAANELYMTVTIDWMQLYDTTSSLTITAQLRGDNGTSLNYFPQTGVGSSPYTTVIVTEYMA